MLEGVVIISLIHGTRPHPHILYNYVLLKGNFHGHNKALNGQHNALLGQIVICNTRSKRVNNKNIT